MIIQILTTCSLAALLSHSVVKKNEPDPLTFLASLTAITPVVFGVIYVSLVQNMWAATMWTCICLATYLSSLTISILVYRHSSWHPLAAFPGPAAAISTKWWMVHRILVKGGRHVKLQELHQRHGRWIRVGPNELSINDPAAVQTVSGRLNRAPFYTGAPAKADSLITVLDRRRHAERRHAWSKALTGEAVYSYVPIVEKRVKDLLSHIEHGGVVNMDAWLNLFFMDLMGDLGFQGGFETMKAGKDVDGWLGVLSTGVMFVNAIGQVPWTKNVFKLFPQPGPLETFHTFTHSKVNEIRKQQASGTIRRDILGTVFDESAERGYAKLSFDEAAADMALIVVAATDTGVQTVLAFLRYIATDAHRRDILQQELKDVSLQLKETAEMDVPSLLGLPYLDACIQECLRILPPGPFGPPRTSGPHGVQVLDKWIPPNTTLHIPIFTMHRDPSNFGPLADQWIPERWLPNEDPSLQPCRREAFVPFSTGYSSCIGKQLALQNIKILIGYLMCTFEVTLAPQFDVDAYDKSYKEFGLWTHDALEVQLSARR